MMYVATINVPGYVSQDDSPPEYETAAEAWAYLAEQRREGESRAAEDSCEDDYSETVAQLGAMSAPGVVYGPTPGRTDSPYDLGLAYCVIGVEAETEEDRSWTWMVETTKDHGFLTCGDVDAGLCESCCTRDTSQAHGYDRVCTVGRQGDGCQEWHDAGHCVHTDHPCNCRVCV